MYWMVLRRPSEPAGIIAEVGFGRNSTLIFAVCATIPVTICSVLPHQEKSRRFHQAEFVTPMGQ
jgi:hypothetical protein